LRNDRAVGFRDHDRLAAAGAVKVECATGHIDLAARQGVDAEIAASDRRGFGDVVGDDPAIRPGRQQALVAAAVEDVDHCAVVEGDLAAGLSLDYDVASAAEGHIEVAGVDPAGRAVGE
jgi:hypothetical protein